MAKTNPQFEQSRVQQLEGQINAQQGRGKRKQTRKPNRGKRK